MMNSLKIAKVVDALPAPLDANTVYLLKVGSLVEIYVTDALGEAAYKTGGGTVALDALLNVSTLDSKHNDVLTFDLDTQMWVNKSVPTETTFTRTDVLQVVTGVARYYPLKDCTINAMWGWVGLASVGSDISFALRKNGVVAAIGTISAGQFQMVNQTNMNIPLMANDYLTLDITGIGSSVPGSELRLRLQFN